MEEFFNHRKQLGIPKGGYLSAKDAGTFRAFTPSAVSSLGKVKSSTSALTRSF
jgi:hypothetical protein